MLLNKLNFKLRPNQIFCLLYKTTSFFILVECDMTTNIGKEAVVRIVNINILDNPTIMTNPFQLEIIFQSKCDLREGFPFLLYIM